MLFLLMLGCLVAGTAKMGHDDTVESVYFYPVGDETGVYAYVDVAGVSDWLYDVDGTVYYALEDTEGYLYIAKLSDSTFDKMAEQQRYWNRTSDSERPAEIYRIYGITESMDLETKTDIASVFEMDVPEFEEYFGDMCLDTSSSPSENIGWMWICFAILAFCIWMAFAIEGGRNKRNLKKGLNELENNGMLDRAADELQSPLVEEIGKGKLYLTRNFIFSKSTGVIVNYRDIVWMYKRTQRTNFIVTGTYLIINTVKKGNINLLETEGKDKKGLLDKAAQVICDRNPDVLVGFDKENRRLYNEIAKQAKNR